jgi:hypothetical protein
MLSYQHKFSNMYCTAVKADPGHIEFLIRTIIVSKINYSLVFRDIRYWVAINLVRLEAMWFLVTNKRYRNHIKNVRQRILYNTCK